MLDDAIPDSVNSEYINFLAKQATIVSLCSIESHRLSALIVDIVNGDLGISGGHESPGRLLGQIPIELVVDVALVIEGCAISIPAILMGEEGG